jgi:hypothetical protein
MNCIVNTVDVQKLLLLRLSLSAIDNLRHPILVVSNVGKGSLHRHLNK